MSLVTRAILTPLRMLKNSRVEYGVKFFDLTGAEIDLGSLDDRLAALEPPAITSVEPAVGLEGAEVTITGRGFTGATEVLFGSLAATDVVVVDADHITCVVPAENEGI
jgi:hypothetical protein